MPGIRARIMLQGHLWIHVTVGEVKTAPTRKDASLSGCHMVYTGNGGAGHFCQCNFPGRIFLRPGIFFAGKISAMKPVDDGFFFKSKSSAGIFYKKIAGFFRVKTFLAENHNVPKGAGWCPPVMHKSGRCLQ
jgi:hypothetical protein